MKTPTRIGISLAAAALMVLLGVVVSFWSFRQIQDAAAARKHSFILIKSADRLLSAIKDAETGQRGYLLTGDETFLEPYSAVRDSVGSDLKQLRQLASTGSEQEKLDVLTPLVEAKLARMASAILLRRNGDASAALAIVQSGQGKQLMDSIRSEMGSFISAEEATLAQNDEAFQSDMRRLFVILVAASLLTLVLAVELSRCATAWHAITWLPSLFAS